MREKSFTLHDLPVSERPRERLCVYGADRLSTPELLALLLGRGIAGESVVVTAQRLMKHFGSLKGIYEATLEQLTEVRGIGTAKAAQILAAFELAKRVDKDGSSDKKSVIKTPEDAAALLGGRLSEKKKEYFLAILLDTRGRHIRTAEISIGSLDTSIVHPREVFKEALAASAATVIFVHNHPSGDTEPSDDDISLTKRLADAGNIMGIDVIDHLIIGGGDFRSLKREGYF